MRAVLDTNVLVSRLIMPNGKPAQIIHACESGAFTFLVSEPILAECRKVLGYKRIRARHHLDDNQIADSVAAFRKIAVLVDIDIKLDVIRDDPDDNRVLECAVSGEADFIVSGDAHLLNLGEYRGIQIVSPAAFLLVLDQG